MNKSSFTFPENINEFHFLKEIYKKEGKSNYYHAFYENKNGQQVFAKIWKGKFKNLLYYWLNNEINIYKNFNKLKQLNEDSILIQNSKIQIPKLYYYIQEHNYLLLLIGYVEGMSIDKINLNSRISAYQSLLEYFQILGEEINKYQINDFYKRGNCLIILLFLFYCFQFIFKYPKKIIWLLRSLLIFIKLLPTLLKNRNCQFIHRDIGGNNAVIKNNIIYIFDFQLSVITNPIFEVVSIIVDQWFDQEFINNFYQTKIMNEILNNSNKKRQYQALGIYTAIIDILISGKIRSEISFLYLKHLINL